MSTFPTLFEWIERFEFLRGRPATYLILLAGLVIVAVWEWRLALLALIGQYLLAGLLFVEVLEPRLAIVKVLVGLFIALILYLTARQAGEAEWHFPRFAPAGAGRSPWERIVPLLTPDNMLFRLLLALLLLLAIVSLVDRPGYQLPAVPASVNLAVFGLVGLGLLTTTLSADPFRTGMGLLMVMLGFELFYNSLDQSVAILLVLAALNLTIALATSYLAQARPTTRAGEPLSAE